MISKDVIRLNKEQLEAVKHASGPLLIIAGAGTGKTTVITERIKHLIISKKTKPEEILALTFTEKAAREMEERVDVSMPFGYTQMWISTFHSFCDRVLRAEALHIGLDPKFKLLKTTDATQLVRKNLFKFELDYFLSLGSPNKFIGGMLQHFSRLQDEDVDTSQYLIWVRKKAKNKRTKNKEEKLEIKKWMELAKAYRKYDELKTGGGYMDFGDLITKTLKLFRERPNILKEYQKKFKYILVDEFQDTNIAQNELATLLSRKHKNITVVGDDDQAIYRFRGASISNIIQFRKTFPKAKVVTLTKNYRSGQEILNRAHDLIQHNNPDRLEVVENVDKKLISQKKTIKSEVSFMHLDRVENEADAVAKKIQSLVSDDLLEFGDIAILVRANNHAEPFTRALLRHAIPFQFLGPGRLFKAPEIIDLISYLRVLNNFEDSVSMYRILSLDYFEVNARDLAAIGNFARRKNVSTFEACEKLSGISVSKDTRRKVKKIIEIINKHLKLVARESAGQILYYFLEDTGLMSFLLNPKDIGVEKKALNVSKFFDKLKTYEVDHEDANVSAVVDWIDLAAELGESPLATDADWTNVNAVNILTVHSSKGLEFPVVFLVNLVSLRFPSVSRREQIPIPDEMIKEMLPIGDFHLQEERRLFYVGMTRAKEKVFLTAADYYGEAKREKKLSPFIFEALGDKTVSVEGAVVDKNQLSFLDFEKKEDTINRPSDRLMTHVDYLSFSQINTFTICPLHYKLKYIFRVPTPSSPAQSFGTSIHSTMDIFYKSHLEGRRVTKKTLLNIFSEEWVNEGYKNRAHEKKTFEKGKKILEEYYEKEFDRKTKQLGLETMFKIPLRKKGERPLVIGGMIDKIEKKEGGIEIIDYKTGDRVPSQKEADNDLQLTIYALAATKIKSKPFDKNPKDVTLTLHFLEKGKKVSTTRTVKQLREAEVEIFKIRKAIEKSNFACSDHYFCKNCEYKLMCNSD